MPITYRFRTAPTCPGQTDRQTDVISV